MSDATDVLHAVDQLRRDLSGYHGQLKAHDDLQRHCDNQRKRIGELEGLYAGAKAEVAELKEQTRWMAQTDSRWEAAVRDCEQAQAENAKLRELVRDMWPHVRHRSRMCGECDLPCDESDECLLYGPMRDSMRELGIEVESWRSNGTSGNAPTADASGRSTLRKTMRTARYST